MKDNQKTCPTIHESVFIAEGARIYGDVKILEGASVWFNAVIRGDEGPVEIGMDTIVQDNVVIHSDLGMPLNIGKRVTIGHGAVIRSCKIGSDVMVGMNATVMSKSEIGEQSIVGANALISYDQHFPPQSLIIGSPAKAVRPLTPEEQTYNQIAIDIYKDLIQRYRSGEIQEISR